VQRHRYSQLHPWQRYNHIPGFPAWDRKDNFARGFQEYRERNPEKKLDFLPETYTLGNEEGRLAFEERLNNGGLEQPWVLKVSVQERVDRFLATGVLFSPPYEDS